jgi:putative RecB family exonuclease
VAARADRILTGVALTPPRTLTPSKVSAFTNCALAFRFSQIERRPEPPSPHSVKGTLVHAALEGLFWHHPPGDRSPAAAGAELERAWVALQDDEEFTLLELDAGAAEAFLADARTLVDNYFRLEDPDHAHAIGVELGVEAMVDGMGGVQTYALLCESVLGRAPSEVRLLYLRQPVAISTAASEQTIRGQRKRAVAVWTAIERACDAEDFRPHVGPLCDYCHFKDSCPAFAA